MACTIPFANADGVDKDNVNFGIFIKEQCITKREAFKPFIANLYFVTVL